jgi:hypothetical protein
MNPPCAICRLAATVAVASFTFGVTPHPLLAQEQPSVTEITPTTFVFATSTGNVVASIGPEGALLIGTPSVASTPFINSIIAQRTKSPGRYVVIFPSNVTKLESDAGWGRLGAFVAMHENALRRLGVPGDGYPFIDAAHGGSLEGLLSQLVWVDPKQQIVRRGAK